LRLVLSDETQVLLVVEKEVVHPRNRILDRLAIVALLLEKVLEEHQCRTKLEGKALAHIRNITKIHKKG